MSFDKLITEEKLDARGVPESVKPNGPNGTCRRDVDTIALQNGAVLIDTPGRVTTTVPPKQGGSNPRDSRLLRQDLGLANVPPTGHLDVKYKEGFLGFTKKPTSIDTKFMAINDFEGQLPFIEVYRGKANGQPDRITNPVGIDEERMTYELKATGLSGDPKDARVQLDVKNITGKLVSRYTLDGKGPHGEKLAEAVSLFNNKTHPGTPLRNDTWDGYNNGLYATQIISNKASPEELAEAALKIKTPYTVKESGFFAPQHAPDKTGLHVVQTNLTSLVIAQGDCEMPEKAAATPAKAGGGKSKGHTK